ncbi:hypothetical protein IGI04_002445, partial [Brassica rapa subsp. trilocularis]
AREFAYDIVSLLLVLVKLCNFFKFQEEFWIVSGKLSRKLDVNKFEKPFAWCLVWLTHVDMFGRLANFLMTKDIGSFRKAFQKI